MSHSNSIETRSIKKEVINMSDYILTSDGELMHYGVPGMKWGVRRNAKLLANHNRNLEVRNIKNKYRRGEITKQQKRAAIKNANTGVKKSYKTTMANISNAKNRNDYKSAKKNLAQQTLKNVSHSRLKKGLTAVNKLITVGYLSANAGVLAASTAVNPAIGGIAITALAGHAAVQAGRQYVTQKILNRIA